MSAVESCQAGPFTIELVDDGDGFRVRIGDRSFGGYLYGGAVARGDARLKATVLMQGIRGGITYALKQMAAAPEATKALSTQSIRLDEVEERLKKRLDAQAYSLTAHSDSIGELRERVDALDAQINGEGVPGELHLPGILKYADSIERRVKMLEDAIDPPAAQETDQDALVERLAKALFQVRREYGYPAIATEWDELAPDVRATWLPRARKVVEG